MKSLSTTISTGVDHKTPPKRRMIAVGKKQNGRWQVRTSLWRYLASTAISQ